MPSSVIPILVRAGSILPFKPEEEAGRWNWDDPDLLATSLVWRAFPSKTGTADSTFTLPNGTAAHLSQHGTTVAVDGQSSTQRDYELILRSRQEPAPVRLNGALLPAYTPGRNGRAASQWWWNSSSSELHIRFHADRFQCEVDGIVPTQYDE